MIPKVSESLYQHMDTMTVATKCLARGLLRNADVQHFNNMLMSGIAPVASVNRNLIGKLEEKGIKGYNTFKEILGQVGDLGHKELLRKINDAEESSASGGVDLSKLPDVPDTLPEDDKLEKVQKC